jgi:heme-degrading monooxygenase HmoA
MTRSHLFSIAAFALCAACSSSDDAKNVAADPGTVTDGCARDTLESDLALTPLSGSQVKDGDLAAPGPDGYVVSTTFLRLKPGDDTAARFQELVSPILQRLVTQSGLAGFQLGLSTSCNTARTLSVWESTEAMYDFVGSDVHMTAVNAVSDVSRGGSIVVHWQAPTADEASWSSATETLAAANGPWY